MTKRVLIGPEDIDSTDYLTKTEKYKFKHMVSELTEKRAKNKTQIAPKDGISLMDAERRYGINHGTLSRWADKGHVKELERTKNVRYIDEASLVEAIKKYNKAPGQGKKTILADI